MTHSTDPRALRIAFGRFATGVAVVTTLAPNGAPVGLTVNSFSSVSLDPPLVLWGLMRRSTLLPLFLESPRFAVNVLAAEQEDLSDRFASRAENRFAGAGWEPGGGGMPLLFFASRYAALRPAALAA